MQPEDGQRERHVQRLADRATGHFADCKNSGHKVCMSESESESE